MFDIKERFDLDPFTIEQGDAVFRTLYEITDKEWEQYFSDPAVNSHNDVLQALSGSNWDLLEML